MRCCHALALLCPFQGEDNFLSQFKVLFGFFVSDSARQLVSFLEPRRLTRVCFAAGIAQPVRRAFFSTDMQINKQTPWL